MEINNHLFSVDSLLDYSAKINGSKLFLTQEYLSRVDYWCKLLSDCSDIHHGGRKILFRQLADNIVSASTVSRAVVDNPSIVDRTIERPVIIASFPRTGSSLLHNIIAQDKSFKYLTLSDALRPVLSAKKHTAAEVYADHWMSVFQSFMPSADGLVRVSNELPVECCFLKRNSLLCESMLYQVPVNVEDAFFQDKNNTRLMYQSMALQMKLLQRKTNQRWLLKCPTHFWHLDTLLEVFPDAHVIVINRNISESVLSFISVVSQIRGGLLKTARQNDLSRELLAVSFKWFNRYRAFREVYKGEQIIEIQYEDLINKPEDTVHSIYERISGERALTDLSHIKRWTQSGWLKNSTPHHYDFSSLGLSEDCFKKFNSAF